MKSSLAVLRTYLGLIRHVEPQNGFRSCRAVSGHGSIAAIDLVSKSCHATVAGVLVLGPGSCVTACLRYFLTLTLNVQLLCPLNATDRAARELEEFTLRSPC